MSDLFNGGENEVRGRHSVTIFFKNKVMPAKFHFQSPCQKDRQVYFAVRRPISTPLSHDDKVKPRLQYRLDLYYNFLIYSKLN